MHIDYQARYETLREVYREEHPRITHEAIDAFVDGKIAGGGVAAGEPSTATQQINDPSCDQD